jgi:hypothetical protein
MRILNTEVNFCHARPGEYDWNLQGIPVLGKLPLRHPLLSHTLFAPKKVNQPNALSVIYYETRYPPGL